MNRVFIILLLLTSCIEPFEFNRNNLDPQLVIEAYISDISYNESLQAPSNGRYFIVKLKFTRPVDKFHGDRITPFAEVKIIDDLDNEWMYYENTREWGTYILPDKDFEACNDRMYKLQITTHDELISGGELVYESDWEKLPSTTPSPIEEIWFEEDERKTYYYPAGEREVGDEKIINISTSIPINSDGQVLYYKWEYSPMWVYEAPLATGELLSPYKKCWITSSLYLNDYALEEDVLGGSDKVLFTLDIVKNRRLFKNFSILIFQQRVSKDYFYFVELMQEQSKSNGIFDTPPANLPTNFTCLNDPSKKPVGYFGVVNESTKRWYFNKDDLSYYVEDYLRKECLVNYGRPEDPLVPAAECLYCLANTDGDATLTKPSWWIEN
jgi:hypothetical protein